MSNGIKKTYKKSFYMFQKDKFYQLTKKKRKKLQKKEKKGRKIIPLKDSYFCVLLLRLNMLFCFSLITLLE